MKPLMFHMLDMKIDQKLRFIYQTDRGTRREKQAKNVKYEFVCVEDDVYDCDDGASGWGMLTELLCG